MIEARTRAGVDYVLSRDGVVHREAVEKLDELETEVEELLDAVDSACKALTRSIEVSGNIPADNLAWTRRLRDAWRRVKSRRAMADREESARRT